MEKLYTKIYLGVTIPNDGGSSMKNKEKFFNIIEKKIIQGNTQTQKYIENKLVAEGRLSVPDFDRFITKSLDIKYFDISVLVWVAQALEELDDRICMVIDFFEDVEITNAKMYIYPINSINNHLVIQNVVEIAPNQYLGIMSIEQIGILRRNGIIQAYFEAQRDSVTLKYGDREVKVIKINDKRVDQLMDKIDGDEYAFNELRINVVKDNNGLPIINYNPKAKTISLSKDDLNIIPDGNHRSIACERLLTLYPEKASLYRQKFFGVLITNETILGCKQIVAQEWNREPVSKTQIDSMERNDANLVVEMLLGSDIADDIYKKKIVRTKKEIAIDNGFVLFSCLSNAIESFYGIENIKTRNEKTKLKTWLEKFFNEMTDIMKEDFINYYNVKKINGVYYLLHGMCMFI